MKGSAEINITVAAGRVSLWRSDDEIRVGLSSEDGGGIELALSDDDLRLVFQAAGVLLELAE